MSRKAFFVTGLLVALVIAGIVSYWASSAPDGLNKVAEDKGLNANESDSATSGSPLAGYSTSGVSSAPVSGGLAGVVGVVVVLFIAGGMFAVISRRNNGSADQDGHAAEGSTTTPATPAS